MERISASEPFIKMDVIILNIRPLGTGPELLLIQAAREAGRRGNSKCDEVNPSRGAAELINTREGEAPAEPV